MQIKIRGQNNKLKRNLHILLISGNMSLSLFFNDISTTPHLT